MSFKATSTTDTTPLPATLNPVIDFALVAGSETPSSLTWSWTQPIQGVATLYEIRENGTDNLVATFSWGAGGVGETITGITDSHAADTTYTYYVVATDGVILSSPSNTASGTTSNPVDTNLYPVQNFSYAAGSVKPNQVGLQWTIPVQGGATGYIIKYTGGQTNILSFGSSNYTVTGLTADTTYSFQIFTVDGVGGESTGSTVVIQKTTVATSGSVVVLDFEEGVVGQKPVLWNGGGDLNLWYDNAHVKSGSVALKTTIFQGNQSGYGAIFRLQSVLGKRPVKGDEIWFSMSLYFPASGEVGAPAGSGFLFNTVGTGMKTIRCGTSSGGNIDIYTSIGGGSLFLNSEPEVVIFSDNNTRNGHPPNADGWTSRPLNGGGMPLGQWHTIEQYIKFHDVNGTWKIWRNNTLVFVDTLTPTLEFAGDTVNDVRFCTYWNGRMPDGSQQPAQQTQSTWIDDVMVTDSTPPNLDANGDPFIGII